MAKITTKTRTKKNETEVNKNNKQLIIVSGIIAASAVVGYQIGGVLLGAVAFLGMAGVFSLHPKKGKGVGKYG